MHKVDSSGATAQNEFTNGDAGLGIARTRLEAKWMNTTQRELVAIPTQRGLTLSQTDDQQLLQCLILHVADLTSLRAMPIPSVPGTQTVMVTCRNTGSGFGMSYQWSASSTAADDGNNVIRPSSNPASGRWLSLLMAGAGVASSIAWAGVTGTPTTLAGYGITDAPTKTGGGASGTWNISISGNAASASAVAWTGLSGKPSTIGGYGITDAITTANIGSQSVSFASTANSANSATNAGNASSSTTQSVGTNNTSIATTAFALAQDLGGPAQSWQNVTASRAFNTTYTNTTGRPIFVRAGGLGGNNGLTAILNGVTGFAMSWPAANYLDYIDFIVRAGETYCISVDHGAAPVSPFWWEIR